MIIDSSSLNVNTLQTDVVILGGGASGLTLAAHLKRDLIVIEGGDFHQNLERDKKFIFETTGMEMNNQSLRRQIIGGAGALWAGRCADLDPVDFEKKTWVKYSGWPIAPHVLTPYYAIARNALGIKPSESYMNKNALNEVISVPSESLGLQHWQYAFERPEAPVHIGKLFDPTFLKKNKTLLTNAAATRITTNGKDVKTLQIRDPSGREITIHAKHFVLACGCVETSRFLLDNALENRDLIGPIKKWIGHGFHQHLLVDGGQIKADFDNTKHLQKSFNRFRRKPNHSHEIGLKIHPQAMAKYNISNMSATFRYMDQTPFSPLQSIRLMISKLRGREHIFANPKINIELSIEQDIDYENKISLGTKIDSEGRRNASVHWSLNKLELRSACKMNDILSDWLAQNKMGTIQRLRTPEDILEQPMRESLHHMGGARMSQDPSTGVVDQNLKVHGTKNLSIVGGATFPTGGQVNPTLSMMALSIRLAEHLDNRR